MAQPYPGAIGQHSHRAAIILIVIAYPLWNFWAKGHATQQFLPGLGEVCRAIKRLDKSGDTKLVPIACQTDAHVLALRAGDKLVVDASVGAIKYCQGVLAPAEARNMGARV